MARADTRTLGLNAEQDAARYLEGLGVTIIDRNFRCRLGEIDIIAFDEHCLVFVEVRYRSSGAYSRACDSVDRHKQRKLVRTAALFLAKRPRYADCATRFDVVGINADSDGETTVEWIRDAFRPGDSQL